MKVLFFVCMIISCAAFGNFTNEAISSPTWNIVMVKNDEQPITQIAKDMLYLGDGAFCLFGSSKQQKTSVGILDCYSATEEKKRSIVKCSEAGLLRRSTKNDVPPEFIEVKAGKNVYLVGIYCR